MQQLADKPVPGLSSSIFLDTERFITDFDLVQRYGFTAVAVGCEQTGPALCDTKAYTQLIT